MQDEAQRGEIVALAYGGRQAEQADEHGRDHEDAIYAVFFDQRQQRLGLEAGHEQQQLGRRGGTQGDTVRRAMTERPRQEDPRFGRHAVDGAARLRHELALLR